MSGESTTFADMAKAWGLFSRASNSLGTASFAMKDYVRISLTHEI